MRVVRPPWASGSVITAAVPDCPVLLSAWQHSEWRFVLWLEGTETIRRLNWIRTGQGRVRTGLSQAEWAE